MDNEIIENKNERFYLNFETVNAIKQSTHYKDLHEQFITHGASIGLISQPKTVNVYTPLLAYIFTKYDLKFENLDTKEITTLNVFDYIQTYIQAYYEGEKYFEKTFELTGNVLYGNNAEAYVQDLHFNYFHAKNNELKNGWQFVKNSAPILIRHSIIKEYGYYSGIVNKLDETIKKHPKIFQDNEQQLSLSGTTGCVGTSHIVKD